MTAAPPTLMPIIAPSERFEGVEDEDDFAASAAAEVLALLVLLLVLEDVDEVDEVVVRELEVVGSAVVEAGAALVSVVVGDVEDCWKLSQNL